MGPPLPWAPQSLSLQAAVRGPCVINIYTSVPQSFTQSLKRRMSLRSTLYSCGLTYEIVSNVPKVLPQLTSETSCPASRCGASSEHLLLFRPRRSTRSGRRWPSWQPALRRRSCRAGRATWRNTRGGCWRWRPSWAWSGCGRYAPPPLTPQHSAGEGGLV